MAIFIVERSLRGGSYRIVVDAIGELLKYSAEPINFDEACMSDQSSASMKLDDSNVPLRS